MTEKELTTLRKEARRLAIKASREFKVKKATPELMVQTVLTVQTVLMVTPRCAGRTTGRKKIRLKSKPTLTK